MPAGLTIDPRVKTAERRFVRGEVLHEIAEDLEVPLGTVKTWYTRKEWRSKRERFNRRLDETLFHKTADELAKASLRSIVSGLIAIDIASKALNSHRETLSTLDMNGPDSKGMKYTRKHLTELSKLTKLVGDAGTAMKALTPNAGEQLMEKVLAELKAINEES